MMRLLYLAQCSRMTQGAHRPEDLQRRLVAFGIAVCRSLRDLKRDRITDHIVWQLLRSSMSAAANYAEARAAESRRDFVHKMQICLKELRESLVWLQFASALSTKQSDGAQLVAECNELTAIFAASLKTANRLQSADRSTEAPR
jgi:four helix bundle protein